MEDIPEYMARIISMAKHSPKVQVSRVGTCQWAQSISGNLYQTLMQSLRKQLQYNYGSIDK